MRFVTYVFGEDDGFQFANPNGEGGANIESFRQHQKAFLQECVNRVPTHMDERDLN